MSELGAGGAALLLSWVGRSSVSQRASPSQAPLAPFPLLPSVWQSPCPLGRWRSPPSLPLAQLLKSAGRGISPLPPRRPREEGVSPPSCRSELRPLSFLSFPLLASPLRGSPCTSFVFLSLYFCTFASRPSCQLESVLSPSSQLAERARSFWPHPPLPRSGLARFSYYTPSSLWFSLL